MTETTQLTADDIRGMSQAAIAQALRDGRCADILAGRKPEPREPVVPRHPYSPDDQGQLDADDLPQMTPAQIVKAQADGRFDDLLRGRR